MTQCKLCGEYKPSDSFNWCEKCQEKVVNDAVNRSRKAGVMSDEIKEFDELPSTVIECFERGRPKDACVLSYKMGLRAGQSAKGDARTMIAAKEGVK